MTEPRLRRSRYIAFTAAAVWSSVAIDAYSAAHALPLVDAVRAGGEFVHDSETTYCWGVNANIATSNVEDARVFLQGKGAECPLKLRLTIASTSFAINQSLEMSWTVVKDATSSALFNIDKTPFMIDSNTRRRATIIHSNLHACRYGSGCGPFSLGDPAINATRNQIGNISDNAAAFASSEIKFREAGKYTVLAHIVIPSSSIESRYDFAVFTTVTIGSDRVNTQVTGVTTNEPDKSTAASSPHALSTSQIVIISVVGALLASLAILVSVFSFIKRRQQERDEQIEASTKPSPHGSNVRTRSSDWTELYALDDAIAVNVLSDDSNAIAMLRSSRASTPTGSPSRERSIADFRHEIARWDMRSSASPITPSSSAILMASARDSDRVASTPANDCFVPLESLMPSSPPLVKHEPTFRWTKHFRGSRQPPQPQLSQSYPPDDSGDEQEVEI